MSRVLIVEDEAHLATGLQFNLQEDGHSAEIASDGELALERLLTRHEQFDAIVLDVMLPGKNGFKVAAELREAKNFVPILMLTARGRAEDVLEGFASGADDYIAKPFELPILLARLQGLLRRTEWMRPPAQERAIRRDCELRRGEARRSVAFETQNGACGRTPVTLGRTALLVRSGGRAGP